jgi:pimeloyl-ACP methyl ester carboxylesterase
MCYIVPVLLLIVVHLAYGADYAREKKWADEITPGIVVGDPVYLEGRAGHKFLTIYTAAPNAQAGLVIVHGIGVHPDHGLISTLRIALADHGYTTLSVQMPVLAGEAGHAEYPTTFGEAGERLKVAVEFLHARGYKKIAIVSHSMGSRMTYAYLTRDPREQNPQNARRKHFPGEQISQRFLLLSGNLSASNYPGPAQGARQRLVLHWSGG